MNQLIPISGATPPATVVQGLLAKIRPEWQARKLIQRVTQILPVDPSSACQRLLNATLHDLRSKIVRAGLDIAAQAADLHNLPPVTKPEDVESYSSSRIIDLAYRMGLLTRAQWRRLKRCYEIRRDLEHEDDEYEAEVQDCVYIFATCIDDVLSQDPVELLRVTDVKEVIEQALPQFPGQQFLDDYENAPDPRQKEISLFLVSTALDTGKPDVVRSNAFEMIKHLCGGTRDSVKIEIGQHLQAKIGRGLLDTATMKVAHAAGVASYLKRNSRNDYFSEFLKRLKAVGHEWRKFDDHTPILSELEDVGGLAYCESDETARAILKWLVLCYLGEPGGYGMGRNRAVFFSNTAAPIIKRMLRRSSSRELALVHELRESTSVKAGIGFAPIANRFEELLDLAGDV